jgi:hypothetical protein
MNTLLFMIRINVNNHINREVDTSKHKFSDLFLTYSFLTGTSTQPIDSLVLFPSEVNRHPKSLLLRYETDI